MRVNDAKATPCSTCPLRVSNFDRTDTEHDDWFTQTRRDELWHGGGIYPEHTGIRDGYGLICHKTMNTPSKRACASWVALEHRELLAFVDHANRHGGRVPNALRSYGAGRPNGMTAVGLRRAALRLGYTLPALAAMPLAEVRKLMHPATGDTGIQHGAR